MIWVLRISEIKNLKTGFESRAVFLNIMEIIQSARKGEIKLPPGFRFHPTDEELVVQYLKRKVFCCPLPASVISEVDVFKCSPWDLPGDSSRERYFFSIREAKYRNGCRPNRATDSGFWKATGSDKKIFTSKSNQLVGMKKLLVFHRGKPPHGTRTDWIMHEYRLVSWDTTSGISSQRKNSIQNSMTLMEDWVICRIFLKKRSAATDKGVTHFCNNKQPDNVKVRKPTFFDFMNQNQGSSDSSSLSESSNITEVSSLDSPRSED